MTSSGPNVFSERSKEIEALLKEAGQFEKRGDFQNAVIRYRQALERLPADDPYRERLQSTIGYLEQRGQSLPPAEPEQLGKAHSPFISLGLWGKLIVAITITLSLCVPSVMLFRTLNIVPFPRVNGLEPTTRVPALAPTLPASPPPLAGPSDPTRVFFQDDFNHGRLDSSKWTYDNQRGTLLEWSHGDVRISSGAKRHAYLHTRSNPFPQTGNFQVDIRFRYLRVGTCGASVAMASFILPPGLLQDEANQQSAAAEAKGGVSIWFWHDQIYYRSGPAREDIAMPNPGTDWHDVTVKYVGGQYQIVVDGIALYTSARTTARPQALWFGYPSELLNTCVWDTLEVSHIAVGALP